MLCSSSSAAVVVGGGEVLVRNSGGGLRRWVTARNVGRNVVDGWKRAETLPGC